MAGRRAYYPPQGLAVADIRWQDAPCFPGTFAGKDGPMLHEWASEETEVPILCGWQYYS